MRPISLLRDRVTATTLKQILEETPCRPLLPPLDSAPWLSIRKDACLLRLFHPVLRRAEEEARQKLPALTDHLYGLFHRNGNRLRFERVYFERRRLLARAAIALLLSAAEAPRRAQLEKSLLSKMTAIADETSWAFPAHVSAPSGKDCHQIDLFCAETANLMAELLDLFGPLIPVSLQRHVSLRLQALFRRYRTGSRDFVWSQGESNWNAVCHQGILGAALSQEKDAERLASLLFLASKNLPYFLKGFGKDGGTAEGASYWEYGFGWFSILNQQLELRTLGRLSLFGGDAKVREMARFGPRLSLFGERLVNFGDGGGEGSLRPALLTYLGNRLNLPDCLLLGEENFRHLLRKGLDLDGQRSDLFHFVRILLEFPNRSNSGKAPVNPDHYFPDLAVLVTHGIDRRGRYWDFAAKAGHNGESHNHNDGGSFLLNLDGERLVSEIGSPEYTKDFFDPKKRYSFLATRTLGHSLPVINGQEQADGKQYKCRVLRQSLRPNETLFEVDASRCYPETAGCLLFARTLRFHKEKGILSLKDRFTLTRTDSLEDALISLYPIRLHDHEARIEGRRRTLLVVPSAKTKLDRVETHIYRNHDGEEVSIYRLVMIPRKIKRTVSLEVILRVRR